MSAMFSSLRVVNYRMWFTGALVSNIGTWMQRTAQDWIVLTKLTHNDAAAVGITMALQFGPQLLLVPFSGLIADRANRRKLLICTQVSMGLLALGLGIITLTGVVQLWMVYCFAFGLGVAGAIDAPARQTFVGELVTEKQLPNAVALNSASFNGARLIGPAVAGVLVAVIGSGWVFILNAATFAAVLGSLIFLHRDQMQKVIKAPVKRGQIRDGFRYVKGRPDIVVVFVVIFLIGTFGLNFPIFTSTMARQVFHTGADGFGLLSSVLAVGSLAGSLLAARRDKPKLRYLVVASLGFGVFTLVASRMPTYIGFAVVLVFVGLCSLTLMTSANAYVQTTTTPVMRGRVMALYMAIFAGGTPIGAPIVGWVANVAGPRVSIDLASASGFLAFIVLAIWMIRSRHLHLSYNADTRWRFALTPRIRRELATTELEVVEVEAQRSS